MAAKLIRFNMPFTIPTSQLVWTTHARDRMHQRGVVIPSRLARWELVEKRKQDNGQNTWTLRYRERGMDDLFIVVLKQSSVAYLVITTYYTDEELIG